MLATFSIVGTIFSLIGIGYLSVRKGVFSAQDMVPLGKFVVTFALPALILQAVASQTLGEIFNLPYLAAVFVGSLTVFLTGYLWSRRMAGETRTDSTFAAMGMSCANSGFIGFPILLVALPDVATTALALNMVVENLVMIPLVLIMAEYAKGREASGLALASQLAKRLVRNPIVVALVLGLMISASGWALPSAAARPIELLAKTSAALSLMVIGGTLASLPLQKVSSDVFRIVAGKLLLHPLAIGLALFAFSTIGFGVSDPRLIAAAIILAATPAMTIYPILAQQYHVGGTASFAMLVMTIGALISVSAILTVVLEKISA
jgi:malonate transporter